MAPRFARDRSAGHGCRDRAGRAPAPDRPAPGSRSPGSGRAGAAAHRRYRAAPASAADQRPPGHGTLWRLPRGRPRAGSWTAASPDRPATRQTHGPPPELLPQRVLRGTPVRQAPRAVDDELLALNDPSWSGRIGFARAITARSSPRVPPGKPCATLARFGVPLIGPGRTAPAGSARSLPAAPSLCTSSKRCAARRNLSPVSSHLLGERVIGPGLARCRAGARALCKMLRQQGRKPRQCGLSRGFAGHCGGLRGSACSLRRWCGE